MKKFNALFHRIAIRLSAAAAPETRLQNTGHGATDHVIDGYLEVCTPGFPIPSGSA